MDGLTRVEYPDGSYVSYDYDTSCRLTKVATAYGDTSYEYDKLDRITRVTDRNGYATVYEYDKNGNRSAIKYANGLTVTYEYDKLNRLICEKTIDKDLNVVAKYVYTLGASGERVKVEELDRTVEYTYDNLYRLKSETITEGKKVTVNTYDYDNVSNRTLKAVNGAETVYTYNSLNQLISENDTTYEYDTNGNLIRIIGKDKAAIYEYNSENKLIKATVQSGSNIIVEEYTYDYAGNRTSKSTSCNGQVEYVKYLNDNSSLTNVLVEINADGDEVCYYTIGADLISQEVDGKVSTYLYDGHGTVRALADEDGNVTDTYSYDAFGNMLSSTDTTANNYRYCGEQYDNTTGLYYLRARYMDTSTGRFISQDSYAGSTADPVSLHKYLYANSNPVNCSDPSGYMTLGSVVTSNAIANILFYSCSSGCITFLMGLLREVRNVNNGIQESINWSDIILDSIIAALIGGFFFCAGALALSLSSSAIYLALGGSCLIFFAMSCAAAQSDWNAGNYDLAVLEMIFAAGAAGGAKSCFDNAGAITSATATAQTATNPSTENKNTSQNNTSNTSANNSKISNNKSGGAARSAQYRDGWQSASLKEAIQKNAPESEGYISQNGQKIIYENAITNKRVVYDIQGDYFRIQDMNINGKRCYTDINGNPIPNNTTTENGTQRGITQSEYNQMTHFK